MVRIKKKILGNKEYYYLEHTFRLGKQIEKKEVYVGKTIPENIEKIKNKFLHDIYKEKWYPVLERIKGRFVKAMKHTPPSAKLKDLEAFMIRFTYNTQKIEGSALTLGETANLLEDKITPKNKPVADIKETEAHKKVFYNMLKYKKDLSLQIVLQWHRELFLESKPDIAGKIRRHQVAIARSKFILPFPAELDALLKEFFGWYAQNKNKIHIIELAALVHLKFVTIHPFYDGNGRISRLIMNFVLQKHDYPMLDIPYTKRASYYNALERAQIKKIDHIFVQWFIKQYIKEHDSVKLINDD